MNPDSFIFPAPQFSAVGFDYENFIWIPKQFSAEEEKKEDEIEMDQPPVSTSFSFSSLSSHKPAKKEYIPCMYHAYPEGSNKYLIFFHGNGEDVVINGSFGETLMEFLKVNVICMEYPGYSVYPGDVDANKILSDSLILYDYMTTKVGIESQNIIVFGRSIGSGPATYLAANRDISGLVLMSAYTSIKDIVKRIAGGLASAVIRNRFPNINEMPKVKAPVLFVHGQQDTLIPHTHSIELSKHAKGGFETHFPEYMTHNDFRMGEDLMQPIQQFMEKYGLSPKIGKQDKTFGPAVFLKRELGPQKEKKKPFWAQIAEKLL